MNLPTTPQAAATHGGTNAAIAIILGVYLAIVMYQGNLGSLATAAKHDFLGGNGEQPFWRWAVAVIVLLALARSPKYNFLFGPLLAFALVAMLINVATNNPAMFQNLNTGVATLFGRSATSGA